MDNKELDDLKKLQRDEVAQINTLIEEGEPVSYIFYYSDVGNLRVTCIRHNVKEERKYSFGDYCMIFGVFFCIFTAGYLAGGI